MEPILLAGYPDRYPNVFHRLRVALGDMTIFLESSDRQTSAIVRNIEVERIRGRSRVDEVFCPEDLVDASIISGNRNTAFAQAAAELLRRKGIRTVVSDQMLPLLIVDVLSEAGIKVRCDRSLGIDRRRRKDAWEIDQLREAQRLTEAAIRHAHELLQAADVDANGVLVYEGKPLTSERLRWAVSVFLLQRGLGTPDESIVASGPSSSDCHERGSGPIHIDEPVIIDVFPLHSSSRYYGDCTRSLVRGTASERLVAMHEAVVAAKAAAINVCRAGVTGAEVHEAAMTVLSDRGYHIGSPPDEAPEDLVFCPHGTGHGVGLEVHEPPLLDTRGEELVSGDVVTIEPGLYCRSLGGVRVEDMVVVREDGCENLNSLPEGLWWD